MWREKANPGDKVIARLFEAQGDMLLAACDDQLLGKTLKENDLCLEISEEFYGTSQVTQEQLDEFMDSCTIANLVGEQVVALAIEKTLIRKENTLRIAGVPHAQFARMPQREVI